MKSWLTNTYSMVLGSVLSLFGIGGYEKIAECPDCGAEIAYTEAAMDWHDRTCPANKEAA